MVIVFNPGGRSAVLIVFNPGGMSAMLIVFNPGGMSAMVIVFKSRRDARMVENNAQSSNVSPVGTADHSLRSASAYL